MAALMQRCAAIWACVMLSLSLAAPAPAQAQNPFSVLVRVDDAIITNYELNQRIRFLEILNAQGDVRQTALDQLVNERLQNAAADRLGATASAEAIEEGLEEFASRGGLGPEQFMRQMQSEGVAPETIRDFVANGITWRNVVQARFGALSRPSEAELERELETGSLLSGGLELLLAEIIIPITPDNQATLESELARLGSDLQGDTETFSQAARRFSAAPTREEGGLTGWRPIEALPEGLREILRAMSVGEVTQPIPLGGQAFALFQKRGQREVAAEAPVIAEIDYATIAIPGGRSPEALAEAARIHQGMDTCNDLNGVIPGGFERQSVAPGALPQDIAVAVQGLDDNEMSTQVTRSGGAVLLAVVLCDRVLAEPEGGFDTARARFFSQRLEAYASSYLDELRAEATIIFED